MGLVIGTAAGGYSAYKTAKTNYVDPWDGKRIYPNNDGALVNWTSKTLNPGERIDRYGILKGNYFSPEGTPLEMRSLHPYSNTETYNAFEVVKSFDVSSSVVAPFYNQPGLGIQYKSVMSIETLLNKGYIRPIK
ncbi:TNT domain-containing protein [Maribellus sp. CM-23]|uniref:TNT domain-containing protein n=1 Tax=Maribellus sp. CM-23 TaxID=2781026 RepID=UPI001F3A8D03|nr:TNT domain-containing protein [Maribellus sp. CM-23]MCE4564659.1 TNT domain-containing protein [Maribellus sp. CM-23]